MKTVHLLSLLLFIGVAACNNAPKNNTSESTQTEVKAADQPTLPAVAPDAKVFFKNLQDGQTVSSPFKVEMGIEGIQIEPAGEIHEGFGHHHLLINAGDSFPEGEVIPTDEHHLHFGKGQTETELDLPAGDYQLTLQFADGAHRSYGKQLASSIHVTVK